MPFTFSHPAIVLPLLGKRNKLFSATGLIIGSITPDFESFFLVTDTKILGHTWPGTIWFDMPLGIALMFLFHNVVRDPLIENMPRPLAERFGRFYGFRWNEHFRKNYKTILLSLFIGILSHLVWDAFTHLNIVYPDSTRSHIMIGHWLLYQVLQYACSVIGLVAVAWSIYKLPRYKAAPGNGLKYIYWLVFGLLATLIGTILITVVFAWVEIWLILLIYIIISSSMYSLIIVSTFYTLFVKQRGE